MAGCNSAINNLTNYSEKCALLSNHNFTDCIFGGGFIPYLQILYCTFGTPSTIAGGLVLMFILMIIFIIMLAVAADQYFSPSLVALVKFCRLNDNLAGVTLLAFGNGAADLFSALAAADTTQNGDAGLLLGAVIGAGMIVTTVTVASVSFFKPFAAPKCGLIKDITFYLTAVLYTLGFVLNSYISLYQAIGFLIIYVMYVVVTVFLNKIIKKMTEIKKRKQVKDALYIISSSAALKQFKYIDDEHNRHYQQIFESYQNVNNSINSGLQSDTAKHQFQVPTILIHDAPVETFDSYGQFDLPNSVLNSNNTEMQFLSPPSDPYLGENIRISSSGIDNRENTADRADSSTNLGMTDQLPSSKPSTPHSVSVQNLNCIISPAISRQNSCTNSIHSAGILHSKCIRHRNVSTSSSQQGREMYLAKWITAHGADEENNTRDKFVFQDVIEAVKELFNSTSSSSTSANITSSVDKPNNNAKTTSANHRPRSSSDVTTSHLKNVILVEKKKKLSFLVLSKNYGEFKEQLDTLKTIKCNDKEQPKRIFPKISFHRKRTNSNTVVSIEGYDNKGLAHDSDMTYPPPYHEATQPLPQAGLTQETTIDDLAAVPNTEVLPATNNTTRDSVNAETDLDEIDDFIMPSSRWKHFCIEVNPFPADQWAKQSKISRGYSVLTVIIRLFYMFSTPVVDLEHPTKGWCQILNSIHGIVTPMTWVLLLSGNPSNPPAFENMLGDVFPAYALTLLIGFALFFVIFFTTKWNKRPKYHMLFAAVGFATAILWINCTSTEVVNILTTFGIHFNINPVVLGVTVLACSSSVGDLVSDTVIARRGFPGIAVSACFGGPVFNLLLAFGIPFIKVTMKQPGPDFIYKLALNNVVLIMLGFLILNLVVHYGITFLYDTRKHRIITVVLITIYLVFIIFSIVVGLDILHVPTPHFN